MVYGWMILMQVLGKKKHELEIFIYFYFILFFFISVYEYYGIF